MTAAPIVEVERLSHAAGGRLILRDVSLTVREGEIVSVIGPNGAGKTTLLRCLDRLATAYSGRIRIRGRDARSYSQRELATIIGYVPQAEGRRFPFTVSEFVMMARYPYLSPFATVTPRDHAAVRDALALTGMQDFADRRHATLSGGESQKVFLAAALAQQAPLLLLDEPTTFLDPRHQSDILSILRRANRATGVTILSVTHDVNSAVHVSGRILALKEGRLIYDGRPGGVMNNQLLHTLYGTEFLFATHPRSATPLLVLEPDP